MNLELIDSLVATRDRIMTEQKAAKEECKAKKNEIKEFRDAVFFKVIMPPIKITFEDGLTVAVDSRAKLEALLGWCHARMFEMTGKGMTEYEHDELMRAFWTAIRDDPCPEPPPAEPETSPLVSEQSAPRLLPNPPAPSEYRDPVPSLPEQHEVLAMRRRGMSAESIAAFYNVSKEDVLALLLQRA